MDEFLKSLKAWLYDRTSNPLFFVFVLSWIFWNHKLFIIAFSAGEIWVKLISLDELYSDRSEKLCYMAWLPILTTAFTVVVYPILSNLTFLLHKWYANLFADFKLQLENKTPVDREQYRLLRGELVAFQENAAELESTKNAEITELRRTIATLQQKVVGSENPQKVYPYQDLDDFEREIILKLKDRFDNRESNVRKNSFEEMIGEVAQKSRIEVDVALKKLINRNLINIIGNDLNGEYYFLTDEGKVFAVELMKNNNGDGSNSLPVASPPKLRVDESLKRKWIEEFDGMGGLQQTRYKVALQQCLEKIASPNLTIPVENIAFGIGKGLAERSDTGVLKLTEKGRILAETFL